MEIWVKDRHLTRQKEGGAMSTATMDPKNEPRFSREGLQAFDGLQIRVRDRVFNLLKDLYYREGRNRFTEKDVVHAFEQAFRETLAKYGINPDVRE